MTPVSRWKLDDEAEQRIKELLLSELGKTEDQGKKESIIRMLLSDSEIVMLGKRMAAFVMIDQGLSDTEVSERLHLTRGTVNKLRWVYKYMGEKKEPAVLSLREIIESEKGKKVLKDLLKYAIRAVGGRAPMP